MRLTDLSYVESVAEGNREMMQTLVDIFLEQLPQFSAELDASFAEARWIDMASVAHKAKSSIMAMGMTELATAMKRLEMLGKLMYLRSAAADPASARYADIKRQIDTLPPDIKEWIEANNDVESVKSLISFYKLQTFQATEELKSEVFN